MPPADAPPPAPAPYVLPAPPASASWEEVVAFRYWDGGVPAPCVPPAAPPALPPACAPGSSGAWRAWLASALAAQCQFVGAPPSQRRAFAAPPANASALLLFAVGAGAGAGEEGAPRAALRAALAAWSLSRWAAQFKGRLEIQLLVVGDGGLPAGGLAALAAAGGAHGAALGLPAAGGLWGAWQEGVMGAAHRLGAFPWVILASDGAAGPLTWFPDVLAAAGGGSDDAPPAGFYASSAEGACCAAGAQALAFSGATTGRPPWREFWAKLPAAAAAPGCGSPLPLLPRRVPPARAGAAAERWAFCAASDAHAPLGERSSLAELRRTYVPFIPVGALGDEAADNSSLAVAYVQGLWYGAVLEPCAGAGGEWGPAEADADVGV